MGTICAPSYANIFMDHFERKFIYPFIKTFSLIYFRLIDDIFFIWKGSKTDLENFLNKLNTQHPSIEFEYEISKERISFLDTEIYMKNNNKTTVKKKQLKSSIPYNQVLRIKRICSTKKDFDHHSREPNGRFLKQGYDQKLVDEQLEKVDKLVRDDLLQERDQERQDLIRIPLILTYNRLLPNLTAVVRENWNILQTNKNLRNYSKSTQSQPLRKQKSKGNNRKYTYRKWQCSKKIQKIQFPLEQENAPHFYWAQELYVATKC